MSESAVGQSNSCTAELPPAEVQAFRPTPLQAKSVCATISPGSEKVLTSAGGD